MAEEFQESDVIFSDHHFYGGTSDEEDGYFDYRGMGKSTMTTTATQNGAHVSRNVNSGNSKKTKNKKNKKMSSSVPVNIPSSIFHCPDAEDFEEEEYYDEEGQITPPHVIVGRRIAGKMAFSVCTGNGRTLKGRDLSRVRNTVLRMTGFLET